MGRHPPVGQPARLARSGQHQADREEHRRRAHARRSDGNATTYAANLKAFETKIDDALYGHALVEEYGASKLERLSRRNELIDYLKKKGTYDKLGGWLKKAEPLRGLKIITYHKTWIYFADRFGLDIRAEIEEKPGIPPSQDYLAASSRRSTTRTSR